MNPVEYLLVAASAEFLERWGYEHRTVDVSPWAPRHVQAAWWIVVSAMDEELGVELTFWIDAIVPRTEEARPS